MVAAMATFKFSLAIEWVVQLLFSSRGRAPPLAQEAFSSGAGDLGLPYPSLSLVVVSALVLTGCRIAVLIVPVVFSASSREFFFAWLLLEQAPSLLKLRLIQSPTWPWTQFTIQF